MQFQAASLFFVFFIRLDFKVKENSIQLSAFSFPFGIVFVHSSLWHLKSSLKQFHSPYFIVIG